LVGATEFVKNGHMILDAYEKQLSTPLPNYYAHVTWPDGTCAAVWDYERKLELSCEEGAPFVTTDYNYGPLVEPFYGAYTKFYAGQHFVDEYIFLSVEYFVAIYGCLVLLLGFYLFRVQALAHAEQQLNQVLAQNLEDQVQLNQAKDVFLSNMSHELRTPLNGIYGTLQALQLKDGTNNKLLGMGVRSAEALIDILNDILDIQKISSRQMSINKDWFLAKDLCNEMSALFASSASLKGIKLNVEGESELPEQLFGDRARLSQVLTNLLSNAVKFTAEGVITIKYYYDYKNQLLNITVSDTGIGMKQETISRLFQKFMQADSSSTKHFAGTGLGLAISKELVELMDGEIAVNSVYGEGSQFIVNIPAKARQNESPIQDDVSRGFLKSNSRILLVDDDESNTMVGQDILSYKYDYVDTALSAYMAIELLQKAQYDFVITDISMPDMTGEELLQHILKHYPEIQVIALTGNVYEHQKQKYHQLGFKAVIEKPLNHKVLFDTLEQFELLSNDLSSSDQFGKSIH
jgi:signal transduction histidine kinase/CheY-like chemotaxis protein